MPSGPSAFLLVILFISAFTRSLHGFMVKWTQYKTSTISWGLGSSHPKLFCRIHFPYEINFSSANFYSLCTALIKIGTFFEMHSWRRDTLGKILLVFPDLAPRHLYKMPTNLLMWCFSVSVLQMQLHLKSCLANQSSKTSLIRGKREGSKMSQDFGVERCCLCCVNDEVIHLCFVKDWNLVSCYM